MKQIRISDVHCQVANEKSKKRRLRIEEYIEILVQEDYNKKK